MSENVKKFEWALTIFRFFFYFFLGYFFILPVIFLFFPLFFYFFYNRPNQRQDLETPTLCVHYKPHVARRTLVMLQKPKPNIIQARWMIADHQSNLVGFLEFIAAEHDFDT